jgi:hypothetical protein
VTIKRNNLYALIFFACLAGYIWLFYNINNNAENKIISFCVIKHFTNLPCPSCGSTRSVISILKGNFYDALIINPLGYLVVIIMLVSPIWITIDIMFKKNTLLKFYQNIEYKLKNPFYAFPLLLLIVLNWIWNITKAL